MTTTLEEATKGRPAATQADSLGRRGIQSVARSERLDAIGRRLQDLLARISRGRVGKRSMDFLNGTWLGHPLHPSLTDIPLGAWTAAAVFDLVTVTSKRNLEVAAGAALSVGVVGAVGAALTGLADWSGTGGAARRVGLLHGGLNVAALAMQIASLWGRRRRIRGARALSVAGLGTAAVAAYLGGDLVFRLGTQVDRTAWNSGPRGFTAAMADSDLGAERPACAEVAGAQVMLVRHQGSIYALDDVCSHAGCPLSQGQLEAGAIRCACHGSTFRLRDGAVIHGPSAFAQPCYDVRVEDGQIQVRRRGS